VGGLEPSQGRNFGLKIGGTKLEAPKMPRIEMLKALRGMRNGDEIPLGQWSNYIIMYEWDGKYGEQ